MRYCRTYGSVQGAASNRRPYRDQRDPPFYLFEAYSFDRAVNTSRWVVATWREASRLGLFVCRPHFPSPGIAVFIAHTLHYRRGGQRLCIRQR